MYFSVEKIIRYVDLKHQKSTSEVYEKLEIQQKFKYSLQDEQKKNVT